LFDSGLTSSNLAKIFREGGFTLHSGTRYRPTQINLTQSEFDREKPAASNCPDGHLSGHQPRASLFNFRDSSGNGAFNVLSSLAHKKALTI
jgi:hypothetical protein